MPLFRQAGAPARGRGGDGGHRDDIDGSDFADDRGPLRRIPPSPPSTPAALQEAAAGYRANPASKDARRKLYKALNLEVQQVSASQEQVGKKAARLAALLQGLPAGGPAAADAWLQLAAKLGVQCEVQVARLPGFAFPLAEVAVGVAVAVPGFAPLLVAHLAALCPLCVPCTPRPAPGAQEAAWLRAAGYKVTVDVDTGEVQGVVAGRGFIF